MGQHDHSVVGLATTLSLEKAKYDLLILTGNFVFYYHFNEAQEGEDYFKSIEVLIIRKLVLMLPETRENYDNYLMFHKRF